ncbi:MAG: (d)CMP kinase [Eubacterium sp.]|nr:(d)CMP kinase [Eubacterium sp.]
MSFNIAIDGPSGAGKSTIAKRLANELSFVYVDTGAMYRAMALYFLRKKISPKDEAAIATACAQIDITLAYEDGVQCVLLNGENVNAYIRAEEVGNMASSTSIYPAVRAKLTALQKKLASTCDVIMDGRDIGTCVLPDAQVKIYLTASVSARAGRRYGELIKKGVAADYAQIEADLKERDERDMNREIAPLKQAWDAVLVDSSDLSIDEVLAVLRDIYEKAVEKGVADADVAATKGNE